MRRRPSGVRDQLKPGTSACEAEDAAGTAGEVEVDVAEEEGFFRMPFGGAAGVEDDAGISSIRGLVEEVEALGIDEVPCSSEVGTSTVRGFNLPLDVMLGVPI